MAEKAARTDHFVGLHSAAVADAALNGAAFDDFGAALGASRVAEDEGDPVKAIDVLNAATNLKLEPYQQQIQAMELARICERLVAILNFSGHGSEYKTAFINLREIVTSPWTEQTVGPIVVSLVNVGSYISRALNRLNLCYNYVMSDGTTPINYEAAEREVARRRGLSVEQMRAALDALAPAAPAEPRLQWGKDNAPDENPAVFAWRAYQAEAKAGTLHMGVIRQDDRNNGTELADKLVSWLRSPVNRQQVPEGFDIPTKPEWNTRQLGKRGDALPSGRGTIRPDASRLYDAARYRTNTRT